MKTIHLLRHAKAVAKDATRDMDRVLAPDGRAEMAAMAGHIRAAGIAPDRAIVSTAARTRETWSLAGLPDVPAVFDERVYHAEADDLLALIRAVDPAADSVILVGHNPTFEEMAQRLAGHEAGELLDRVAAGMATAGLATIEQPASTWAEVAFGRGRLVAYAIPDDLGG